MSEKFCKECGAKITGSTGFCSECGAAVDFNQITKTIVEEKKIVEEKIKEKNTLTDKEKDLLDKLIIVVFLSSILTIILFFLNHFLFIVTSVVSFGISLYLIFKPTFTLKGGILFIYNVALIMVLVWVKILLI